MSAWWPHDAPEPVSAPSALKRLDDAVVPALQRRSRAVAHVLGSPVRALEVVDDRVGRGKLARDLYESRGVVAFIIVAVAFGAAVLNFQRYPQVQADRQARQPVVAPTSPEAPVVAAGTGVGPLMNSQLSSYFDDRRRVLAALNGQDRIAVVSFDEFLTPPKAADAVSTVRVELAQYQLPRRDRQVEQLQAGAGLIASFTDLIRELLVGVRTDERAVTQSLDGVADGPQRAQLQAQLDALRGVRNTLTLDPRIVFAVVVRGSATQLQSLAAQDGVRLVDVAPAGTSVAGTDFFGVLPTDQDRFSYGRST